MLLLGARTNGSTDHEVWTARRRFCAEAGEVLRALTDPSLIAEWAPVAFEVDGLAGGCFEIEVRRADAERLELVATGPITFDVTYQLHQRASDLLVQATVGLRRQRGLTAQILRAAAVALLNARALDSALRRLESAVAGPLSRELIAA